MDLFGAVEEIEVIEAEPVARGGTHELGKIDDHAVMEGTLLFSGKVSGFGFLHRPHHLAKKPPLVTNRGLI